MFIKKEFAKLPQLEIYNVNGKKCYYDELREQPTYVEVTPEEIVRQNTVTYLYEKLGVPYEMIYTEDHLRHWGIDENGRMDIAIVYKTNNDDIAHGLAVVECKSEEVPLSEQVYEQGIHYAKCINAQYLFLCNGIEIYQFKGNEYGNYIRLENLVDYNGMTQGKGIVSGDVEFQRCDEDILKHDFKKVVEYAFNNDVIGEDTPDELIVPIVKMFDALGDAKHKLPLIKNQLFTLYNDCGFYFRKYGNASGNRAFGAGLYRDLDIDLSDGSARRVFIGIMSTGKTVNDPVYGTSDGKAMLAVAINEGNRDQLVLELNLNKFMKNDDQMITIVHNGAMRNKGARKEEFLAMVSEKEPSLVRNNQIYLGQFDAKGLLYMDSEDFSQFITNLVTYVLIRAEYKKAKRKAAGK